MSSLWDTHAVEPPTYLSSEERLSFAAALACVEGPLYKYLYTRKLHLEVSIILSCRAQDGDETLLEKSASMNDVEMLLDSKAGTSAHRNLLFHHLHKL